MSVNVHRHHLDASQRALLASRLSALSDEETLSQAGEMMGVSRASVARAAAVKKGPEPLRAAARESVVVGGRRVRAARGKSPRPSSSWSTMFTPARPANLRAAMCTSGASRANRGRGQLTQGQGADCS